MLQRVSALERSVERKLF